MRRLERIERLEVAAKQQKPRPGSFEPTAILEIIERIKAESVLPLEVRLERLKAEPIPSDDWVRLRRWQIRELEIDILERDGMDQDRVQSLRAENRSALRCR